MARPTIMTQGMVEKLEKAFMDGHSDAEACLITGIDKKTLYNYCKENPDFSTKKELLKHTPSIRARRNLVEALNKKEEWATKLYLQTKLREEFSTKQQIENSINYSEIEKTNALLIDIIENRRKELKTASMHATDSKNP